jgi:hypothetical protein
MNIRIDKLLNESNHKMQHLETPTLRADTLLSLVRAERLNRKDPNLIQAAKMGLVKMLDGMNDTEYIQELEYVIEVLKNYMTNNSLDYPLPINKFSKGLTDKFLIIREKIDDIINNR